MWNSTSRTSKCLRKRLKKKEKKKKCISRKIKKLHVILLMMTNYVSLCYVKDCTVGLRKFWRHYLKWQNDAVHVLSPWTNSRTNEQTTGPYVEVRAKLAQDSRYFRANFFIVMLKLGRVTVSGNPALENLTPTSSCKAFPVYTSPGTQQASKRTNATFVLLDPHTHTTLPSCN
jgi:hypothetical protein